MKKTLIPFISILLFLFLTNRSNAQEKILTHKDSLNAILKEYYDLNLKIFQTGSKVEDIDDLFSLFTEDFIYVHPKYGGNYSREDLYNGYKNNQSNGRYNGKIADIKIENKIVGLNAIVVERRFVKKTGDEMNEGEVQMTLFEFKEGKISRIMEYW
ncbi:nuclear transport factor 2 family protein [Marivirga sp. S37H4]|uniref:Nuclear transport factor 2 family protein n=1 Tax=Marivirga aurantiaca TaxID=2802615 RepID=A0A934WYP2_9BACT|nr:nuclear transport factor 2 family protein [Marivirga aurantiaca]MBK6265260.1 nuclear transport factor 2 family protein [Marivirga aurantiaca]